MRSVTFYEEVSIDVDIYDVWDKMTENDKKEFLEKEGLSKLSSKNADEAQDFVYQLSDEEASNIMRWIKFYNKNGSDNV